MLYSIHLTIKDNQQCILSFSLLTITMQHIAQLLLQALFMQQIMGGGATSNSITPKNSKKTSKTDNSPYDFHIISADISQESQERFKTLAESLNKIYPCQITIHKVSDERFCKNKHFYGSYAVYRSLKVGSILPKNIKKCVFLGADMLALSDIRELFNINLEGNLLAATGDFNTNKILPSYLNTEPYQFDKNRFYFNTGTLIIDLEKWRKEKIEQEILNILATYEMDLADQDALNIIAKDKTLKLNPKWNMLLFLMFAVENELKITFEGENAEFYLPYDRETFKEAMQNPAFIHYAGNITHKPWESKYSKIYPQFNAYLPITHSSYAKWWKIALNTPAFNDELAKIKQELDENALQYYITAINNALQMRDNFYSQQIQTLHNAIQSLLSR